MLYLCVLIELAFSLCVLGDDEKYVHDLTEIALGVYRMHMAEYERLHAAWLEELRSPWKQLKRWWSGRPDRCLQILEYTVVEQKIADLEIKRIEREVTRW